MVVVDDDDVVEVVVEIGFTSSLTYNVLIYPVALTLRIYPVPCGIK